ncbi:hypothetical protein H4R33_002987 [Dimargaris cristalligena]|nr:hypothetical protein H4R33_002987 [Dimargaris cristalligena]
MKVNIAAIAVVAATGVCVSTVSATPVSWLGNSKTNNAIEEQVPVEELHPYCAAFQNVTNKGLSAKYRAVERKIIISAHESDLRKGRKNLPIFTKKDKLFTENELNAFKKLQSAFYNAYKGKTNDGLAATPSIDPGMESYALFITANGIRPSLVQTHSEVPYNNAYDKSSNNKSPTRYLILDLQDPVDQEAKIWLQDCYGSTLGSPPNAANIPVDVSVDNGTMPRLGGNPNRSDAAPSALALATQGNPGGFNFPTGQDLSSTNDLSNSYTAPSPPRAQHASGASSNPYAYPERSTVQGEQYNTPPLDIGQTYEYSENRRTAAV